MQSWYIDKDEIDGDAVGQWNGKEDTLEECKSNCEFAFRMLDDDDEVYYYGRCSSNDSFSPLDDFGAPNAGCTTIQYFRSGKWETL